MEARLANVLHLVDAAGNGKVHAVRGDDHRDSGEIHILRHSMVCIKKGKKSLCTLHKDACHQIGYHSTERVLVTTPVDFCRIRMQKKLTLSI